MDKWTQYENLREAFAYPCEGIICHYTSADGLRGIIDNHELWLTNTEFVNDTTECKALRDQKGLLDKYFSNISNKYVIDRWNKFKCQSDKFNNYYIASFSKQSNSLGQYRDYGSFCIGFEAKKLVKKGFSLFECIYDISTIGEWIIEKANVAEWDGNCLDEQTKRMAADALIFAANVKYKNKDYADEKEIRLFSVSNHQHNRKGVLQYSNDFLRWLYKNEPSIYFRDHTVFITPVPYVKFLIPNKAREENEQSKAGEETLIQIKERKLKEEKDCRRQCLPIKELWIGPMLHKEEARVACEILLCEKGYEDTPVNV